MREQKPKQTNVVKRLALYAGFPLRLQRLVSALGLLWLSFSVGCVTDKLVGCIEQNDAVLIEIATGQLEDHVPATALWEREVARACDWSNGE